MKGGTYFQIIKKRPAFPLEYFQTNLGVLYKKKSKIGFIDSTILNQGLREIETERGISFLIKSKTKILFKRRFVFLE